jgi:hypothetical protein
MYICMYLGVAGIFVFSPLYLSIFHLPFHWQSPTLHMHWPYKKKKSSCCKSMQEFCLLWNMYFTLDGDLWVEGKGVWRGGEGRGGVFLVGDFTCFSLFVCLWVAWCGLQRTRPVKLKKKKLESAWGSSYDKLNPKFSLSCTIDLETCSKKQFSCKFFSKCVSHQLPSNGCAWSKQSCNELLTYSPSKQVVWQWATYFPSKQVILQWLPILVVVVVIQRAKTLAQTLFHFSRTASNQ